MKFMKILIIFLLVFITVSCNSFSNEYELLTKFRNKLTDWGIINDVRYFNDSFDKMLYVNLIKKSSNISDFADYIVGIHLKHENGNYIIKGYNVTDFKKNSFKMYAPNKNEAFTSELDDIDISFNLKSEIDRIDAGLYVSNRYFSPYLSNKYLKKLKFKDNLYYSDKLIIKKWYCPFLDQRYPIRARIVFCRTHIFELYKDKYDKELSRYIEEGANLNLYELDEVEKYIQKNLSRFVTIIEELNSKYSKI